ncbi:MAG: site-2 protease family protein [Deltaproteobacteria bacterium]|nr:MAG: site-2 protease family protein [Deltaproteobacteria bacterium]
MAQQPDIIYSLPAAPPKHAAPGPPPSARPRRLWLHVVLFFLTLCSATYSQLPVVPNDSILGFLLRPFVVPGLLWQSLPFALTLMAILLAHEMGHFLTARRLGVEQSLPYFIPAPTIFGTFGAVILMRSQPQNRRALLYVAVMGPFAGLLVALPAAAWGLYHSLPIDPLGPQLQGALVFGDSILFGLLEALFSPNGSDVVLHPVALAGWAGLFITSLNLIPAAQLDGGHVSYALFGRSHERLSLLVVCTMLFFGLQGACLESGGGGSMWLLWAALLFVLGLRHPPVRDESVELSRMQRLCGMAALALFVLTFIPRPISVMAPQVAAGEQFAPEALDDEDFDAAPEQEDAPPAEEYDL